MSLRIDYHLQRDATAMHVEATLHNNSDHDLVDWCLQFDFAKPFEPGRDTLVPSRAGCHIRLAPAMGEPLTAGGVATLQITGEPGLIQRVTDLPMGVYLSAGQADARRHLPVATGSHNVEEAVGHAGSPRAPTASHDAPLETMPAERRLLPMPAAVSWDEGAFTAKALCVVAPDSTAEAATDAVEWLRGQVPIGDGAANLRFETDASLAPEGYRLRVAADGITVRAAGAPGFFYAAVTLEQLATVDGGGLRVPCVTIDDTPRYAVRGFMLDCARHFHTKQTVLGILDQMACWKLNQFHWHLSDDEGWRLEIAAFPALTERGAWRGEGEILEPQYGSGPERYGGFYSHDDVREIVAYAARRQITVVPEIDIPGHSRAAIKACPDLLFEADDVSEYSTPQLYHDNVLNPALPGTYTFLHAVLDQICDLFPGPFIHLGADEVPKGSWEKSPACAAFKAEHGYETAHDLQGHLFDDLQRFLAARGRKLMGWEEAVHGDKLDRTARFNAWTGVAPAVELANAGYEIVACAAPFAYLDMAWNDAPHEPGYYWAGTADLAATYAYDPEKPPADAGQLTDAGRANIVGMQGCLWSELIEDEKRLQFMLYPRLLALAERAWSPEHVNDLDDFVARLPAALARLDRMGVHHRSLAEI